MDDCECSSAVPGALHDSGLFNVRVARLKSGDYQVDRFGTPRGVLNASEEDLSSVPGIGSSTARSILWLLEEGRAYYRISQAPSG